MTGIVAARAPAARPDRGGRARRPGRPRRLRRRRAPPPRLRRLLAGRRARRGGRPPRGIRLTSAVTVLSSDDPVRVFQDFATLDLLSGGRAEIMAGRGSFIESFPLFGYDLDHYDELFAEKLDLLLRLRDAERVTWSGAPPRRPWTTAGVYPRPLQDPLPVWIAVGGTPQSVVRAGVLGLPLALAIIGGSPSASSRSSTSTATRRAGRPRPRDAPRGHQQARLPGRHVQAARPTSSTRLRGRHEPHRARAGLAAHDPRAVRRRCARRAAPLVVGSPRRSPRRSSSSTSSSETAASWRRWAWGRCPTVRSCTPSSCSARSSPRPSAPRSGPDARRAGAAGRGARARSARPGRGPRPSPGTAQRRPGGRARPRRGRPRGRRRPPRPSASRPRGRAAR